MGAYLGSPYLSNLWETLSWLVTKHGAATMLYDHQKVGQSPLTALKKYITRTDLETYAGPQDFQGLLDSYMRMPIKMDALFYKKHVQFDTQIAFGFLTVEPNQSRLPIPVLDENKNGHRNFGRLLPAVIFLKDVDPVALKLSSADGLQGWSFL